MAQFSQAWLEHQRLRWMRPDAYRWFRRDGARFRKAYDPNQPRWPARSGDDSGRWRPPDGLAPVQLASTGKKPGRGAALALALEALRRAAEQFIKDNLLHNLFGKPNATVAITTVDEGHVFGLNSGAANFSGQYSSQDEARANEFGIECWRNIRTK
jgi:hypothetical protein